MQVATLLREVVSGLDLTLNVYAVELVGSNYKLYVDSTRYLNTSKVFELGGVTYTVISFELNASVTVSGASLPAVQMYTLDNPYFTHGKLKAVNIELAQQQEINLMPLIWNFELQPRTRPQEVDTILESTGTVKIFFMTTANYEDYTTAQHYSECIEPMNNLVNAFIEAVKSHNRSGLVFENLRLNHAKFSTGGTGTTASNENNVLGMYLSGIELELILPITIDLSCPTRVYPDSVGPGFDASGFDTGFEIT